LNIAPHIDRFGDIRKMLVDYFQYVLLRKDEPLKKAFLKASREKYGDPLVSTRKTDFTNLLIILSIPIGSLIISQSSTGLFLRRPI
jgi:hypothetical protein